VPKVIDPCIRQLRLFKIRLKDLATKRGTSGVPRRVVKIKRVVSFCGLLVRHAV
jgi:hypothetical protein